MKRSLIKFVLLVAALLWVASMSLFSVSEGESIVVPAEDGSKAIIKFIDKSNFYKDDAGEISLRMDILDPSSQPILGLTKDRFHIQEETIAVPVKELFGPGTQPINVILVIDVSGSMKQEGKMQGAQRAAVAAVQELQVGRDRIGIIAFDDRMTVVQSIADLSDSVLEECKRRINALGPRGGTKIGPPTVEALRMFQDHSCDGHKMIMVMTDGEDKDLPDFIDEISQLSDKVGVPVYTIAFGERMAEPEQVLRRLAEACHGAYFYAPTAEELANIYRSCVEELGNEFLVVYDSPYPKADGLPRTVSVELTASAGALNTSNRYQIGPIITGARSAPKISRDATEGASSGGGAFVLELLLFVVLAALLVFGLVLSDPSLATSLSLQSIRSAIHMAVSSAAASGSRAADTGSTVADTGSTVMPPVSGRTGSTRKPPPAPTRHPPKPRTDTVPQTSVSGEQATSQTNQELQAGRKERPIRKPPPPPPKPGAKKSIRPFKPPKE